jgi:diguanylate cyclase
VLTSITTPELSRGSEKFTIEFDAAVEAHLDWSRRVMRCAVARTSPGADVLSPVAHNLCRFGRWFVANQAAFEKLNPQSAQRLLVVHQSMHDAIRSICLDILADRPGQNADLETFEQTQAELIHLLAEFKTKFLANAVRHDHLTGLPLRYGLEEEFAELQRICKRNHLMLYVAMIDVDHFKRINDSHGHPVGDIALCHLVDTLKRHIRPGQPLFRFGGEEFLLLMQTKSSEEAVLAAQRLINLVRDTPVMVPQIGPLAMTVTMGLCRAKEEMELHQVIECADKALFEGKRAGRDRCIIAPD